MKRGQALHRALFVFAFLAIAGGLPGCYATRFVEDNLIPEHRALQPVAAPLYFPAFWVANAIDVALAPIYAPRYESDGTNIPNYWDYTLQNSWARQVPQRP